ncbi:MAG: iron ABC transporter permease [Pseudomonadota bacterium]
MRWSKRARTIFISIGSALVLIVVVIISLALGTTVTEFETLVRTGFCGTEGGRLWTIILLYRLPRTLLAAIAGAGLASSGLVFQCVLRNPLADPYLIGIAAGGSLGAVISIVFFGERWVIGTSLSAFVGSLLAVVVVYGLAVARRGRDYVNTVILAGVMVGAVMNAVMLLVLSISDSDEKQRIIFWLMGDFSVADYRKVSAAGLVLLVGWVCIYLNANRLNLLTTGDDTAAHLGLDVSKARALFMAVAAMITGAIVSVSGTIGFVGLVVPHTMRLLFGPDNRVLLPASLIGGAAFLAASDCAARVAAYPVELPVGVITILTGGPFFLYLLIRR